MDIGVPTNVRHVAHVTFDRFNGFLGLPFEFEPEVPRTPPSASASVFGVSTKSMQLSFDTRGNSVPTILLMMQRRLYMHGGLQTEGIFRINGRNGLEESIREQLNMGLVPEDIDVHCLAGLIKTWFRELPDGVLDSLRPEKIMQAQSEQECCQLVRMLPPTEAALLGWTINLMTDVAQLEIFNKMNARSVALVFAPNMTRMEDPLIALRHAVQVMNFLKTLIEKTLRDREDFLVETDSLSDLEPALDENEPNKPMSEKTNLMTIKELLLSDKETLMDGPARLSRGNSKRETDNDKVAVVNNRDSSGKGQMHYTCAACHGKGTGVHEVNMNINARKVRFREPTKSNVRRGYRRHNEHRYTGESSRGGAITGLNPRSQRNEAWR